VLLETVVPHGVVFARATGVALLALAVTEGAVGWPGI
jgi:hypothetical protein